MTRYILRRKSDGLFYNPNKRTKSAVWKDGFWHDSIHSAKLYTSKGHPRLAFSGPYISYQDDRVKHLPAKLREKARARIRRMNFDREYEILKVELEWQGVKP